MFQRHKARECSSEPDHEQGDADRLRFGGLHPGELLHDIRRYTHTLELEKKVHPKICNHGEGPY